MGQGYSQAVVIAGGFGAGWQPGGDPDSGRLDLANLDRLPAREVPVAALAAGPYLRAGGTSDAHVRLLADAASDTQLPPILVQDDGWRVIDGNHRLAAARLRGDHAIRARFVDCTDAEALVLAMTANAAHGLPLSRADRVAGARRVLAAHPDWSDRALAGITGLSAKTIASGSPPPRARRPPNPAASAASARTAARLPGQHTGRPPPRRRLPPPPTPTPPPPGRPRNVERLPRHRPRRLRPAPPRHQPRPQRPPAASAPACPPLRPGPPADGHSHQPLRRAPPTSQPIGRPPRRRHRRYSPIDRPARRSALTSRYRPRPTPPPRAPPAAPTAPHRRGPRLVSDRREARPRPGHPVYPRRQGLPALDGPARHRPQCGFGGSSPPPSRRTGTPSWPPSPRPSPPNGHNSPTSSKRATKPPSNHPPRPVPNGVIRYECHIHVVLYA